MLRICAHNQTANPACAGPRTRESPGRTVVGRPCASIVRTKPELRHSYAPIVPFKRAPVVKKCAKIVNQIKKTSDVETAISAPLGSGVVCKMISERNQYVTIGLYCLTKKIEKTKTLPTMDCRVSVTSPLPRASPRISPGGGLGGIA